MDAIKFLTEKHRMCKSTLCIKCKLSLNNNERRIPCETYIVKHPEEAVAIVKQWSKENPLKTNRDKFFELFPKAPTCRNYPMNVMPCGLGWCTESECMRCNHCNQPDEFCWDLPYEGDD